MTIVKTKDEKFSQNFLHRRCHLLLLVMRAGGLLFGSGSEKEPNTFGQRCLFRLGDIGRYYCVNQFILNTLTLSYVLMKDVADIIAFSHLPMSESLPRIIGPVNASIWVVFVLLVHLIFIRASWKGEVFGDLIKKYETNRYICLHPSTCARSSTKFINAMNRKTNCLTATAAVLMVTQMLMSYEENITNFSSVFYGEPAGYWPNNVIYGLEQVGRVLCTHSICIVNIAPLFLFMMIGYILSEDFDHLSYDLSLSVSNTGCLERSLEWFRSRHEKLCELLEDTNDIFSFHVLLSLIYGVVQLFMHMYSNMFVLTSSVTMGRTFFYFLSNLLLIGIILWAGKMVNKAAHSTLKVLYRIDHGKVCKLEALSLQSFLNKLTCNRIGFTAWDLFNIDGAAISNIATTYITYQILLVQLQLDVKNGPQACDGPVSTNASA